MGIAGDVAKGVVTAVLTFVIVVALIIGGIWACIHFDLHIKILRWLIRG